MKHPPAPTSQQLDIFVARCFVLISWLFRIVARLGAPRKSKRLRRAIEWAERCVERIIFLHAVARMPPQPIRIHRPLNTPPGFRRAARTKRLFFRYARIAMRGGSFAQRIARLIGVLAKPEPYVARFLALIARGLRAGALIAAAPPAHTFASAQALAPTAADSS